MKRALHPLNLGCPGPSRLFPDRCSGDHSRIRTVDLNDDATRAAETQRLISGGKGNRVFLNPRDGKPWRTDAQIRKTLRVPPCARAEIDYRNPYQVLHTYASTLLTDGHNPWYVVAQ